MASRGRDLRRQHLARLPGRRPRRASPSLERSLRAPTASSTRRSARRSIDGDGAERADAGLLQRRHRRGAHLERRAQSATDPGRHGDRDPVGAGSARPLGTQRRHRHDRGRRLRAWRSTATSSAGFTWVAGAPFGAPNRAPAAPVLQTPANGATGVTSPATLSVAVADGDGDPVTVTYYGRLKPAAAPDFTYVTIPDTQHYVDNTTLPGDVHGPDELDRRQPGGDEHRVRLAPGRHGRASGPVPDRVAARRHQHDRARREQRPVRRLAGQSRSEQRRRRGASTTSTSRRRGSSAGRGTSAISGRTRIDPINRLNKNNYELFSVGGLDFLVIHIEMDWPDYAVTWADKIIKKYPNRRVILSTHLFLNTSNARPTAAQFRGTDGTSAEAVWQQLIKPNCNVFMVVNGHYPGEGPPHRSEQLRAAGPPGADGLPEPRQRRRRMAAVLRVQAVGEQDRRPTPTRRRATRRASRPTTAASSCSTTTCRARRSRSSARPPMWRPAAWPPRRGAGSCPRGRYEWYATVTDGKITTTGPVWSFTAAAANVAPVANRRLGHDSRGHAGDDRRPRQRHGRRRRHVVGGERHPARRTEPRPSTVTAR